MQEKQYPKYLDRGWFSSEFNFILAKGLQNKVKVFFINLTWIYILSLAFAYFRTSNSIDYFYELLASMRFLILFCLFAVLWRWGIMKFYKIKR
jgi:hypothetical protein